jgi:hypothetical protein
MGFRGMRFVLHMVMRKICGGKMEKITGGCRKL